MTCIADGFMNDDIYTHEMVQPAICMMRTCWKHRIGGRPDF